MPTVKLHKIHIVDFHFSTTILIKRRIMNINYYIWLLKVKNREKTVKKQFKRKDSLGSPFGEQASFLASIYHCFMEFERERNSVQH